MIATFFVIFYVYCTWTTCAFEAERYSTSTQDEKQLPQELSTCHEVILVQSVAINDLAKERDQRLIETMLEAKKDGKSSLDAKMWAYSGIEDRPYDIFDFQVSRHRDGSAEFLSGYQRESKLILNRLGTWLGGELAKSVLPASKLGQAFQYMRNHWEALCVYVKDGGLPIDNNWVERLMKRIAIGRKNWLFVGSVRAGIRNANRCELVYATRTS